MVKPNPIILRMALLLGASGVILGALGAHALRSVLSPELLDSFNTGVKYQIFHAIYILILSLIPGKRYQQAAWITFIGVLMFSGSIYCLSIDNYIGLNLRFLGPITPLGGLFMISGWIRPMIGKSN